MKSNETMGYTDRYQLEKNGFLPVQRMLMKKISMRRIQPSDKG